jgi:hypothetical protein
MLGPLELVVGHLALDDAGVGTQTPRREQLEEEFLGGLLVGVTECFGGKSPRVRRSYGARRGVCG